MGIYQVIFDCLDDEYWGHVKIMRPRGLGGLVSKILDEI